MTNKWISVEDRLPKIFTRVKFIASGEIYGGEITGFYQGYGEFFYCGISGYRATHWMPLTNLPTQEDR